MTTTNVTAYRKNDDGSKIYEINYISVNFNDPQELIETTKPYLKVEVKAVQDTPSYCVHINPLVITKEAAAVIGHEWDNTTPGKTENLELDFDTIIVKMYETIQGHTCLNPDVFQRFRSEAKTLYQKAEAEDKALLFCKHGHFDLVSRQDRIMTKEGGIIPLSNITVLQNQ